MDTMNYMVLAIAAIIPAAFYFFYIIAFDSQKMEPPKVLLFSALTGMVAAFAVIATGLPITPEESQIAEAHGWKESIAIGFLGVAVPAELAKWLLLCVFLSLNKYYDEFVDGVVYSVCLGMGFAGIWCVWYMTEYKNDPPFELMEKGLLIFFILVPLHLMASTFMGYYLGMARKKYRIKNHLLALLSAILVDGLFCSLVAIIGNHWEYYFIVAIVFSILAMVAYTRVYRLLKLDGINPKN